jgi:hypothetical protein
MLGEGIYRLLRTSTTNFPAILDSLSVADPYNADIAIIIDRTAPIGTNVTYSGLKQSIGSKGNFLIPNNVCSDLVSSSSDKMSIVSMNFVANDGQGFSCPAPSKLSSAYCQAPMIRGPPLPLLLAVVCADEAGNTAQGFVSIPIAAEGMFVYLFFL